MSAVIRTRAGRSWALRAAACAAALLGLATGATQASEAGKNPDPGGALRARYAALKDVAGQSQIHRPLHMDSGESPDGVRGEIHALLDHPFATAGGALATPSQWCEILSLHLNTKYCRPSTAGKATTLHVAIGRKYDQPLEEAYRVAFVYQVAARTANYLQVKLGADEGPLGTRDYRIVLEAAPADAGRTIVRLSYSYSHGAMGRLAMKTYLGTAGRNKVGFTVVGKDPDGQPRYIDGMRGVVERNTMRYYLAIEAHLGALSTPVQARAEKSRRDWFAAVERYPRQLHEMERTEYLDMKRREHARRQSEVLTGTGSAAKAGG